MGAGVDGADRAGSWSRPATYAALEHYCFGIFNYLESTEKQAVAKDAAVLSLFSKVIELGCLQAKRERRIDKFA